MKLILRTSIRTCKRCNASSKAEALLECHPTDTKIDRLVPYKAAYLPAGVRPQDIERRTEVGPIAICSNCIDGLRPSISGTGKVVHMDGRDFDGETSVRPNRFVLRPPAAKEKIKAVKPTKKGKEHFSLDQFLDSLPSAG